jgi:tetratricopeptide (TPR) repeat protein/transcriptional regulator with XRE-family HTH domain
MSASPSSPFGRELRERRVQQGLSQEKLAELSGVSPRQISSLESGQTIWPRKGTTQRLADALGVKGPARQKFEEIARGRVTATGSVLVGASGAMRTLPRDILSFTGREDQMRDLAAKADAERTRGRAAVYTIDGMPGVGKTAFAIHAAHRLTPLFPDGHVFLPLAGHVPGRTPMRPTDALAALLLATGMEAKQIPGGQVARVELWRGWLTDKRLLLLLDDAASSDQVVPLLPGSGNVMVIITSRRHLTALEDARTMTLDVLPAEQAAELLVKHADRAGLDPVDAEIARISRLCGYLPLAIGAMGRLLHHHPAWSPADLVADLSQQRDRLELMRTENVSVAAAFGLSYQQLSPGEQRMFRLLALHPGTGIDAYAAAALNGGTIGKARRHLVALYDQHLLAEPKHGRYLLHDLTREYASSITRDQDAESDRNEAVNRLLAYYQRGAEAADSLLTQFTRPARSSPEPRGIKAAPNLSGPAAALAFLRGERANLLACITFASRSNARARSVALTAATASLLRVDGPWTTAIACHSAAARAARETGDQLREADALHDLGVVRRMSGDYKTSGQELAAALTLYRLHDDDLGAANALASLSTVYRLSGNYSAAAAAAEEALATYRRFDDWRGQVSTLTTLGIVRYFAGKSRESMSALQEGLDLARSVGERRAEASVLAHVGVANRLAGRYEASVAALQAAVRILQGTGERLEKANALIHLAMTKQAMGSQDDAVAALESALSIYRDLGDRLGQGNTLTLLGPARYQAGDAQASLEALNGAREIMRGLGEKMGEANALYYIGRVYRQAGNYPESERALGQSLALYRSIDVPGGAAVVFNELGTLHRLHGSLKQAESDHREALKLAARTSSDGDKADALAGLGRCARAAGRPDDARVRFRQARKILQRIKAPGVEEIDAELSQLEPG